MEPEIGEQTSIRAEKENLDFDDDIYGDIDDFDLGTEIDKAHDKNRLLEENIEVLKNDNETLIGALRQLTNEKNNLMKNISSLYLTAQTEINRKNRIITDLRTQLEDLQFRRLGKRKCMHESEQRPSKIIKIESTEQPVTSENNLQKKSGDVLPGREEKNNLQKKCDDVMSGKEEKNKFYGGVQPKQERVPNCNSNFEGTEKLARSESTESDKNKIETNRERSRHHIDTSELDRDRNRPYHDHFRNRSNGRYQKNDYRRYDRFKENYGRNSDDEKSRTRDDNFEHNGRYDDRNRRSRRDFWNERNRFRCERSDSRSHSYNRDSRHPEYNGKYERIDDKKKRFSSKDRESDRSNNFDRHNGDSRRRFVDKDRQETRRERHKSESDPSLLKNKIVNEEKFTEKQDKTKTICFSRISYAEYKERQLCIGETDVGNMETQRKKILQELSELEPDANSSDGTLFEDDDFNSIVDDETDTLQLAITLKQPNKEDNKKISCTDTEENLGTNESKGGTVDLKLKATKKLNRPAEDTDEKLSNKLAMAKKKSDDELSIDNCKRKITKKLKLVQNLEKKVLTPIKNVMKVKERGKKVNDKIQMENHLGRTSCNEQNKAVEQGKNKSSSLAAHKEENIVNVELVSSTVKATKGKHFVEESITEHPIDSNQKKKNEHSPSRVGKENKTMQKNLSNPKIEAVKGKLFIEDEAIQCAPEKDRFIDTDHLAGNPKDSVEIKRSERNLISSNNDGKISDEVISHKPGDRSEKSSSTLWTAGLLECKDWKKRLIEDINVVKVEKKDKKTEGSFKVQNDVKAADGQLEGKESLRGASNHLIEKVSDELKSGLENDLNICDEVPLIQKNAQTYISTTNELQRIKNKPENKSKFITSENDEKNNQSSKTNVKGKLVTSSKLEDNKNVNKSKETTNEHNCKKLNENNMENITEIKTDNKAINSASVKRQVRSRSLHVKELFGSSNSEDSSDEELPLATKKRRRTKSFTENPLKVGNENKKLGEKLEHNNPKDSMKNYRIPKKQLPLKAQNSKGGSLETKIEREQSSNKSDEKKKEKVYKNEHENKVVQINNNENGKIEDNKSNKDTIDRASQKDDNPKENSINKSRKRELSETKEKTETLYHNRVKDITRNKIETTKSTKTSKKKSRNPYQPTTEEATKKQSKPEVKISKPPEFSVIANIGELSSVDNIKDILKKSCEEPEESNNGNLEVNELLCSEPPVVENTNLLSSSKKDATCQWSDQINILFDVNASLQKQDHENSPSEDLTNSQTGGKIVLLSEVRLTPVSSVEFSSNTSLENCHNVEWVVTEVIDKVNVKTADAALQELNDSTGSVSKKETEEVGRGEDSIHERNTKQENISNDAVGSSVTINEISTDKKDETCIETTIEKKKPRIRGANKKQIEPKELRRSKRNIKNCEKDKTEIMAVEKPLPLSTNEEENESSLSSKEIQSSLHLTHDGEIPILTLDENHFSNLSKEIASKNPDKNIEKLLDCMYMPNIGCDIIKETGENKNSETITAVEAINESLTFENIFTSTPLVSKVTSDFPTSDTTLTSSGANNCTGNDDSGCIRKTVLFTDMTEKENSETSGNPSLSTDTTEIASDVSHLSGGVVENANTSVAITKSSTENSSLDINTNGNSSTVVKKNGSVPRRRRCQIVRIV